MSTRATYSINGTSFYIHYDGYQQGAAHYFVNMLDSYHKPVNEQGGLYRTANGGFAEAFLRGNDQASFISNHNEIGDTEFRYTLEGNKLRVQIRKDWDSDEWKTENWDLAEFINEYNEWTNDRALKIKLSRYSDKETLHTTRTIQYVVEDKERTKEVWEKNGHDKGANYRGLIDELEMIFEQMVSFSKVA